MNSLQNYENKKKKSIARPYIRRDCFVIHQKILDNFIHVANSEVEVHNKHNPSEKRQKLTEAHRSLMQQIYFEAVEQFEIQLKLFGNTELSPAPFVIGNPIRVNTNNNNLAYRLSRSAPRVASTIYRRLERLRECGGIVSKIGHGTQANYDLYVNPDIILLWDADDENYHPSSKFLKGGESVVYIHEHARCKPSKGSISFRKNKKTIAVDSSSTVDNPSEPVASAEQNEMCTLPPVERTMFFKRTPEATPRTGLGNGAEFDVKGEAREKDTQAGGAAADFGSLAAENSQRRAFVAAEYLYKYAVWLLWNGDPDIDNKFLPQHLRTLYGGSLWDGKKIHRPEELQAIRYLATQYFSNDTSPLGLERQIQNMQNRIRIAADYLNRQDYYRNGQWFVTPSAFFDQNNRHGFVGTYKWINQAREWKDQKANRADYRRQMLKRLENYLANPTVESFSRQLIAVRRAAPNLEAEFLQRATSMPLGKGKTKVQTGGEFQQMLAQVREYRLANHPFAIVNP